MYCAQLAAEDQQVESLLEAIELVNALPKDHPLRTESDRYIEIWSQQILDLADEAFQDGNLNQAVQAARRIPENTTARKLVDSQIKQWQAIWADAQKIYDDAEAALAQEDLREAFLIATRLLNIDNRYWGTAKYKELTEVITATRQDIEKLAKAREFSEKGGLENLVEAIRLAEQIRSESRVYQEAQKRIAAYGRGMLDLANNALERRDYDEAASIARQIPDVPTLKEEVRDFRTLADAQSVAWGGSVADLEIAINEAKKLQRGRPLYDRAQELIAYWQIEIEDVRRLDRARQLAQPGTPPALAAAIAEAQQIPPENPRGEEAQDEIKRWSETIQSAEDRPILDRAEQLARAGDINSLQAAIEEASRIGADRALSDEAGRLIQDWTARVQRMQDQPRLAQARALAARGDLVGAINVASQIDEGRVMYYEAQSDINEWQYRLEQSEDQPRLEAARRLASQGNLEDAIQVAGQIPAGRSLYGEAQGQIDDWRNAAVGEERLRQADRMAGIGTYPMLLSAIQTANSIAEDSPARSEADQLINQWSLDILQIAEERADINVSAAIAIAETIPSYTEAYEAAQLRIRAWRERLGN
jgi:soluble cytochrome b562